ncbi:MAG: hypothetical protein IPL61_37175 [Myxococcales bacterium]|nr:hypothetical protein [Myxococcales bacterium]
MARPPTADLADAALTTIAQRVMGERGLALDEDGLEALLATLPAAPAHDDDELGYYTAVVELAAVTGAVLRAQFGGRWVDDPRQMSDIPFVFALSRDGGFTNVVGKAQKYFRYGDHESPVQLLRAAEDLGRDAGPLLFTLKPSGWEPATTMICAPIATGLDATGADVPLMVFGHDRPNTFAMMTRDAPEADPPAALRERALRNLAEVEVQVDTLELGAVSVRVVHDSYFAAEKILDQAFLRRLHAELACELLAVAVPAKSRLLVTRGVASVEAIGAFMTVVRGIYDEDEGGRQLSPTVFLVSDGAIVGVASATAPKKRGFWARLFGRS